MQDIIDRLNQGDTVRVYTINGMADLKQDTQVVRAVRLNLRPGTGKAVTREQVSKQDIEQYIKDINARQI